MAEMYASGRIIDLILILVMLEACALWLYRRRTGRGPAFATLAPTLASGALLMLALRAGLAGAWWGWVALPLVLALAAHVVDLVLRWRAPDH